MEDNDKKLSSGSSGKRSGLFKENKADGKQSSSVSKSADTGGGLSKNDAAIANKPSASSASSKMDKFNSIVEGMSNESVQKVYNAILNEAGDLVLDIKNREALRDSLGVDTDVADSWKTAADVIRHFDSVYYFQKNPQQAKDILCTVLGMIPFPVTKIVGLLLNSIPAESLSKIMGVSLALTPEHLAHIIADYQANSTKERTALFMIDPPSEEGMTDLVAVIKDDLLFNQLKKLIQSEDDEDDEVIVGVRDGTCRIQRWDERKWLYRSRTDTLNAKTLVLGDVKGTEDGIKVMDVKFENYGVRYGWIGNCAYVTADRSCLRSKGMYEEFLKELAELPVPESISKTKKFRFNVKTALKLALATPLIAKDIYDDNVAVTRQMYFYGVIKFYFGHLEEFLHS